MRYLYQFIVLSWLTWSVLVNSTPSDYKRVGIDVVERQEQNDIENGLLVRDHRDRKDREFRIHRDDREHKEDRYRIDHRDHSDHRDNRNHNDHRKNHRSIKKKKKEIIKKKEKKKKHHRPTTSHRVIPTRKPTSTRKPPVTTKAPPKSTSTTKTTSSSVVVRPVTSSATKSSTTSSSTTSSSSTSSTIYTSGLPLPTYSLTRQNRMADFFQDDDYWSFWYNAGDPTHGSVTYVNKSEAYSLGLIGVNTNDQTFIRASQENLALGENRPSVRFQSNPAYDSALVIVDVAKMPVGCATWPAIWSVMGSEWPEHGEIDFMEGIGYTSGGNNANLMSVHMNNTAYLTSSNDSYLGKMANSNCMTNYGLGNTGCDFYDSNVNGPSFGVDFNNAGGGIWAALWGNNMGVRIWFWGRQSGLIPPELSNPNISPSTLNPSKWGKPMADFQASIIDQKLRQQTIVLDLTINGDWAGNVPMDNTAQCGTNHTIALANGSNYVDAEFILNGIDVYT